MKKLVILIGMLLIFGSAVSAQTEADLKSYFEGQQVYVKLDMPATKDGVNIYPDRAQPLDYGDYAKRLKQYGIALRTGESVMVTKIKVKGKHIEFQLGGGGYGTAGDETDTGSSYTPLSKSRREKDLEDRVKNETDPQRKRELKRELDHLRDRREREDRRNEAIAADAAEARRARIEQKALQGGSRFNIHFERSIESQVLTPAVIKEALRKYLDFAQTSDGNASLFQKTSFSTERRRHFNSSVINLGPRTTYLKKGLTADEVVRLLGQPLNVRHPSDGRTVYMFQRGQNRVLIAEFVGSILVDSRIESSRQLALLR
jgi:hypothetical protein